MKPSTIKEELEKAQLIIKNLDIQIKKIYDDFNQVSYNNRHYNKKWNPIVREYSKKIIGLFNRLNFILSYYKAEKVTHSLSGDEYSNVDFIKEDYIFSHNSYDYAYYLSDFYNLTCRQINLIKKKRRELNLK